jgi:hypothetical protein
MDYCIAGSPGSRGWSSIDHMQLLLQRACGGRSAHLRAMPPRWQRALTLVRGKPSGAEAVILVARTPSDFAAIATIPELRRKCHTRAAFVSDAFHYDWFPREAAWFDRIFVTRQEDVEAVARRTGRPVSYLPVGTDAMGLVREAFSTRVPRTVDLLIYGRQIPEYEKNRVAERARGLGLTVQVDIPMDQEPEANQRAVLGALVQAKFGLGFCSSLGYYFGFSRPLAMLTPRWLDNLAAGTVMLGKAPQPAGSAALLGWEGGCVDIPLTLEEGLPVIQRLVREYDERVAWRNHYESVVRNDWRLRFRDMFAELGVPAPAPLVAELEQLARYRSSLEQMLDLPAAGRVSA